MSDKARLLARLQKGRVVNQTLLERLARQISAPMAGRVLTRVTKLYESGVAGEETYDAVVAIIKKEKPQVKAKSKPKKPRKSPLYSSSVAPLGIMLKGMAKYY